MEVIKTSDLPVSRPSVFKRILAYQLILALAWSGIGTTFAASATPVVAGDVSVQGDSAAQQNIGRAMQSPEARSSNLPNRNTLQSQPTIVLPDMGDPGGDSLSRVDERKYGEMIMRQIRPDADYSNDLPIYDFLNQMERVCCKQPRRRNWVVQMSKAVVLTTLKSLRLKTAVLMHLLYLVGLLAFIQV